MKVLPLEARRKSPALADELRSRRHVGRDGATGTGCRDGEDWLLPALKGQQL